MRIEVLFAGIGGQGIRLMGEILGKAVVEQLNLYATLITRYTPEVRGGPIHVELVIADSPIDYPRVKNPDISIVLHDRPVIEDPEVEDAIRAAFKAWNGQKLAVKSKVVRHIIISDAKLAKEAPGIHLDISGEAEKIGRRAFNMLALGVAVRLLKELGIPIEVEHVIAALKDMRKYTEENEKAIRRGFELASQTIEEAA